MMERPYDVLTPDEMARWDRAMRRAEGLRCGTEIDNDDAADDVEEEPAGEERTDGTVTRMTPRLERVGALLL